MNRPLVQDVLMLVDDVPESMGALCTDLEHEGYNVLVARSGPAALDLLDMVVPDAILMDAVMPGMGGFDTCRRLKSHPAWGHIPVIFMTGLADTEHVVEGFNAGGVDYVVKPVRSEEVLVRLSTHVRNARAVRIAQQALDVGGMGVLVTDRRGRIAWESPQASTWRKACGPEAMAADLFPWLTSETAPSASASGEASAPRTHALPDGSMLAVQRLGEAGMGETMWILRRSESGKEALSRLAAAALTPRETEVLSWVAKGKTNRDIAEILGMSPRTVNKHLEHVFEKLGVETRAAAAALASRELGG